MTVVCSSHTGSLLTSDQFPQSIHDDGPLLEKRITRHTVSRARLRDTHFIVLTMRMHQRKASAQVGELGKLQLLNLPTCIPRYTDVELAQPVWVLPSCWRVERLQRF